MNSSPRGRHLGWQLNDSSQKFFESNRAAEGVAAASIIRDRREVDRDKRKHVLAAVVNTTVVAGENLTVGSTVWLPAESVAPGR